MFRRRGVPDCTGGGIAHNRILRRISGHIWPSMISAVHMTSSSQCSRLAYVPTRTTVFAPPWGILRDTHPDDRGSSYWYDARVIS